MYTNNFGSRPPMSNFLQERVLDVRHWTEALFSFTTTRDPSFRFENGQFTMIGLEVEGRPLLRAYSVASPNYEDHLEFYSIKVQGGPLTSRLQRLGRRSQGAPQLTEREPLAAPLEQPDGELLLQLRQRLARRRLRHAQRLASLTDAVVPGHGQKNLELSQGVAHIGISD